MQGSLILKPLEAKLQRNLSSFSKMDPYCVGRYGNLSLKGQVCKGGATNPYWSEALVFELHEEGLCFLEVKDKDVVGKDSIIGICQIEIEKAKEERRSTKWHSLYYNQKVVGEIQIEVEYTEQSYPSRVIVYPVQTRPKKAEESSSLSSKYNSTLTLTKHLPKTQENPSEQREEPRNETNQMNVQPEAAPLKEENLEKKEETKKKPEKKQKVKEPKEKKPKEKKEKKAKKTETNVEPEGEKKVSEEVTSINASKETGPTQTEKPEKKKRTWNFFKSFKKSSKENQETQDKKEEGKKEEKPLTDDPMAPLQRRKVGEEGIEPQRSNDILARKKPSLLDDNTANYYSTTDKENINQGDTLQRSEYSKGLVDHNVYYESLARAKNLVNKVKEQYGDSTDGNREQSRWRSQEQQNGGGIFVEDLKTQGKIESNYDTPVFNSTYERKTFEFGDRTNYKY